MKGTDATGLPGLKSGGRWPFIILGLLSAHVLLMLVAVTIAIHDPSFSVEPNYYQKGLSWDESRAQLRASEKLGWQVHVEASESVDPLGRRAVSFVLTDSAGKAIEGATLSVDYFHHAHAEQDFQATPASDPSDGRRFSQVLPMRYAGTWEFHFIAKARGKTFIASSTEYVTNARTGLDKSKA